jgi:cytochrome d ubiquinol oxidase subunit II
LMLPIVFVLIAALSAASFDVRSDLADNFRRYPALDILPLATILAFAATFVFHRRGDDSRALISHCAAMAALLASAGASLFPRLLPAYGSPANDLTITNCAAPPHNLLTAMIAWLIAIAAIAVYTTFVHHVFRGKLVAADSH